MVGSTQSDGAFEVAEETESRSNGRSASVYPTVVEPIAASDRRPLIGIVDENGFTRECIAKSLDPTFNVVATASAEELCSSGDNLQSIVVHLHPRSPDHPNMDAAFSEIRELARIAPVVVLSSSNQPDLIRQTFQQGARGYIPTASTGLSLMTEIVRLVHAGGTFVPLVGLGVQVDEPADPEGAAEPRQFTRRETMVLKLLKQGKTNRTIAHELSLSESTIKVYVRNIMHKMKVSNRTAIVCRSLAMKAVLAAMWLPYIRWALAQGGELA